MPGWRPARCAGGRAREPRRGDQSASRPGGASPGPAQFVGVANYLKLPRDELFWTSLYNTVYVTLLGVPIQMATALGLALLLNQKVKGIAFFRTAFYLPSLTPTVAGAILWVWLLNNQWGILNSVLRGIGIGAPVWLGDPQWSKPAIILMGTWSAGAAMIIYLAGLQGVPEQLYEAASIDGANNWRKFLHVTLPMLTPTIFFTAVIGIIAHFQIFTEAYILTQGGPLHSTLFYVYYLFNNGFVYFKMGYAAARAWVLFAVVLVLTLIQFRLARTWVYYEAGEVK
ncbi:MAG: sugar ABC transporter permease [Chloroflexi bacterium]|nr:sugar ABC transporter permease [Chloroflexota bacterium]